MSAEFIIYRFYDSGLQGAEVGRVEVSTYKWGPKNAINKFVRENKPPAGRYLVTGDQKVTGDTSAVFNIYTVSYPEFVIDRSQN